MTIEASFIIPLSLFLIILLIQMGFFLYEKSISVQCCYLAALRGSNAWELSGSKLEQYVEKSLEELWNEKQLYHIEEEKEIKVDITGVEVSITGNLQIPFSKVRGDNILGWNMDSHKKAIRNKPSSFIRKYQIIKE